MIRVSAVLSLLAAVFIANGLVSLYFLSQTEDIILAEKEVIERVDIVDRLQQAVIDAETAQRGYLITGEQRYLAPYDDDKKQANRMISRLTEPEVLAKLNSRDKRAVEALRKEIVAKFNEMDQTIQLINNSDRQAAFDLVETDQGLELMKDIKERLSLLRETEFKLLDSELRASERAATHAFRSVLAANLIGFLLICTIALLQRRAYDRSEDLNEKLETANSDLEKANNQLEQTNDNLEEIVETRTKVLEEQADVLTRSNRELESFAYVASHDLQEPLRKIRAFGDRLDERYGDRLDDRGRDYLARMRSASERMSTMINDLLSLSRAKSQELVMKPVPLSQVFRMALADLDTALRESNGTVEVHDLPVVHGDAIQLLQVFSNLISNAIKYRSPNRTAHIVVRASKPEPAPADLRLGEKLMTKITVEDNGIGFDEGLTEKVFAMFQRLHGRSDYQGNGIGLAICRKIVERHGGAILVEQVAEDAGTTFAVYLPAFVSEDN